MSSTSIQPSTDRESRRESSRVLNFVVAGAISFVSNVWCHVALGKVYFQYADYCSVPDFHRAANTPLGFSIVALFQLPALLFWFSRERGLGAVLIAIASNAVVAAIWWWWITPLC